MLAYEYERCYLRGPFLGVMKKTTTSTESVLRESFKKSVTWNVAAVQRGLESKIRGLATVRSHFQATTIEDSAGKERVWSFCHDLYVVRESNFQTETASIVTSHYITILKLILNIKFMKLLAWFRCINFGNNGDRVNKAMISRDTSVPWNALNSCATASFSVTNLLIYHSVSYPPRAVRKAA